MSARRDVGFPNDDGIGGLFRACSGIGLQPPVMPTDCALIGRGAVLADHAIGSLVEAHGAANLAGVEDRGDFAVRLLVEPEANLGPIFLGFKAMEIAVGNLRRAECSPVRL